MEQIVCCGLVPMGRPKTTLEVHAAEQFDATCRSRGARIAGRLRSARQGWIDEKVRAQRFFQNLERAAETGKFENVKPSIKMPLHGPPILVHFNGV